MGWEKLYLVKVAGMDRSASRKMGFNFGSEYIIRLTRDCSGDYSGACVVSQFPNSLEIGLRWKTIHEATRSGFVGGTWCGFVDRSYVNHRTTRNETQTLPARGIELQSALFDS